MTEEVRGKMMNPQGNPEDEDNDDVFVECEPVVVHEVPDRSGYRSSGSMDSTSSETSPFGRTNVEYCISSSTTHRSRIHHHQTQFLEERQQLEDITANNRDSKFLTEAIHSEKEFFDYLMSLPTVETTTSNPMRCARKPNTPNIAPEHDDSSQNDNNSDVPTSTSANPKVGLDHLDNLCKLMEQLGDLRKKNVKLQKRVQYLEELRTLNELRKELRDAVQSSLLAQQQPCITTRATSASKPTTSRSSSDTKQHQHHSVRIALQEETGDEQQAGEEVSSMVRSSRSRHHVEDTTWYGSDETLLDKDTGPVTTTKGSGKAYSRLRRSLMRRRTRSKSVGNVELGGRSSDGFKSRISRWTKVREALKWERAQVGHQQGGAAFYVDVSSLQNTTSHTPSPNTITLLAVGTGGGSGSSPASSTAGGAGDSGVCLSEDGISTLSQQQQQHQPRTSTSPETDLTLISLGLHPMDDGDLLLAKYLEENALLDSSSDESAHGGDENDRFEGEGGDQMCSLIDAEDITAVMQRRQSSPLHVYLSREPLVDNELGRKGKSLDRDVVPRMLAKFAQAEKEKKIHKGAWGRVKNIIQTRKDSLKRKQRKTNAPYEADNADDEDAALDTNARPISAAEAEAEEEDAEDDVQVTSKPKLNTKIKRGRPAPISINVVSSEALDVPRKTTRGGSSMIKKISDVEGGTTSYGPLDDSVLCSSGAYSPPTHHRKSKWTRMKKALLSKREVEEQGADCRTQSVPSSPTVAVAFSYDDLDLMDDDDAPTIRVRKGSRSNSNLAERSAELERNLAELQRNLSEDFSRKLEEWEHKRCGSKRSSSTTLVSSSSSSGVHQHRPGSPSKSGERMPAHATNLKAPSSRKVKSEQRDTKDTKTGKQREKELHWLEKQLQKVEREKQRLAKERQKYMEREARLERLRESVITSSTGTKGGPQEVLVRTAAGEFRFAGISQTFTRKLYEWEEMKGIGPEVSTIALLDPNYRSGGPGGQEQTQDGTTVVKRTMSTLQDTLQPPSSVFGGRLDRNRSRSESSLVDLANVQTSTTSLVGIRGHDDDDDDDYDDVDLFSRIGAQSRASSEPDVSTIGVDAKPWFSPPCAIEVEEMHIEETSPCIEIPEVSVEEPVYSYAPPEVARISTMEVEVVTERTVCSDKKNGVQESYSSLIDENMELMKKLRDKEEICRKLENDLENMETQSKLQLNQQHQNIDPEGLRSQIQNEGIEMPGGHSAQRENLEKVLREQRTQQENIAQRLVEKLSELQSTQLINLSLSSQFQMSADKNSLAPPQSSTISPGVHKIQELSGDLCIQAKKLEQALIERNTTIRNLRWELLKRDMNVTPLESPQHKAPPDNSRPLLQRGTHSRMWSSVDAVLMSDMGKEVKSSPEKPKVTAYKALRTVDSVELECLPQQITAKVQDLKDELARLWSSLGMNTGDTVQQATMESVTNEEDKGQKDKESTDTEIIISGKENMKPGLRELTARRVSDTCVTCDQKPILPEAISLAKPVRKFAPHKPKPLVIDKKPLENVIGTDNESSSESANEDSAGVTVNLRTVASTKSPQIPTGLRSPSRVPRSLSTPAKPARVTKTTPDASPTAPWRKPRPVALPDAGPATAPAVLTPTQSPILPWRNRNTQMENVLDKDMGMESPISKSRSARLLKRPAKTFASGDNISIPVSPPTPPTRSKPAFPKPMRIPGKDPAPNIKLMIEKFNQKVEVATQDSRKVTKSLSAGSSKSNIPFFTGGVGSKGLKAEESPEVVIQKSVSFSSALPQQHNVSVPASPNQRQSRDTVRKSESAGSFPTKTASPRTIRAPSCGPPPSPGTLSRIPRPSGPPPLPSSEATKTTVTVPEVVVAIATKTIPAPPTVPPRDDSNHPGNINRAWQLKKAREEFLSRIPSPSAERKVPLPQTESMNTESEPGQPTVPTRRESLRRAPSDKTRKPKDSDKIAKGILKTWRCSFPKGNATDADSNEKENQRINNTGHNNDDEDDEEEKDFSLPSGLLKSASAGMIDAETTAAIFKRMSSQLSETSTASTVSGDDLIGMTSTSDRQSQPQPHHHKSGIFGFRFRKCKLKKKDSDPLPAVKALCRQSLFVDLSTSEGKQSQHQQQPEARSCPSSPELKTRQRGKGSWFSKPKGLFRGK